MFGAARFKRRPFTMLAILSFFFAAIVVAAVLLCINVIFEGVRNNSDELAAAGSFGNAAGRYLLMHRPQSKVLFIVRPDQASALETAKMLDEFKRGYGYSDVMVAALQPPVDANGHVLPFSARDFDALIGAATDAEVIVNTVGLPADAAEMKIWGNSAAGRRLMLLNGGYFCSTRDMINLLKRDGALAVVVERKRPFDENQKSLSDDDFASRYVIVDRRNLPEHLGELRRDIYDNSREYNQL